MQPLQDHLLHTALLNCKALSANRCSVSHKIQKIEQRLPQCHHHMAFWRPSSHLNYCFNSKLNHSPRRMTQSFVSQRPEKWMCRAKASPGSLTNSLFKTIFCLKLSYQLQALSLVRMAQNYVFLNNGLKLCLPVTWTMNVQSWGFPSVTDEQPFQDHLATQTFTSTGSSVSQETWTMNVQSQGFTSVIKEQHFQDHLLNKPTVST